MLKQIASTMPTYYCFLTGIGAIGYIELNYHEVQCLEVALYFLTSQLDSKYPHKLFSHLHHDQVLRLSDWLNDKTWRVRLQFDGKNKIKWPVFSLEVAELFALACENMNEETIVSLSADMASAEQDMALLYAGLDTTFSQHYRPFYNRYQKMANLKDPLATKFRAILNN